MSSEKHREQRRRGARKTPVDFDARDEPGGRTSARHATRKSKRLRHLSNEDEAVGPRLSWRDLDDDEYR
jgi:hypothetical protein